MERFWLQTGEENLINTTPAKKDLHMKFLGL